ncbi:MAG: DUF433 domain-containing protein [Opitutales bacterium]
MTSWICSRDPEVMSGELCFTGTRVPVRNLFDALQAGESVQDFLEGFPSVSREQVMAVLEDSKHHALEAQSA